MPPTSTPNPLAPHREGMWSLPEFVDLVNDLLPAYLPKNATGRVVDEVNPRLVRHYGTQGLLPEPRREGREARYLYEHLVTMLVVRRLLAEGFGSGAIGPRGPRSGPPRGAPRWRPADRARAGRHRTGPRREGSLPRQSAPARGPRPSARGCEQHHP